MKFNMSVAEEFVYTFSLLFPIQTTDLYNEGEKSREYESHE